MIKFSAVTKRGDLIYFTLEDCPVYLNDSLVILAKHEGSALLLADTIVRYDDENDIAEGDKVYYDNNLIGWVIYKCGFVLQDLKGNLKELNLSKHIKVKKGGNMSRQKIKEFGNFEPILLKYKSRKFSLRAILQYDNGFIVIHSQDDYHRKVVADDIKLLTGVDDYCYGDCTDDGGRVVLHDLRPCVAKGNGFTNLSDYRRI